MTRRLLALVFLFVATVGFVAGASTESDDHDESAERASVAEGEEGHDEAPEAAEREAAESEHDESAEEEETILGLDLESPGLIAVGAVVSLGLAALVWFRSRRGVWIAIVVFAAGFALLDLAELQRQLDESSNGRAALAALVAVAHGTLAVTALTALRDRSPMSTA